MSSAANTGTSSSWWRPDPKVLSIQSHVVHGVCGNRAATFPMELHGVVVNPLNVVNFSNHTGYKTFKGKRVPAEDFIELIQGLKENGFMDYYYTTILTGYVGNPAVLQAVADTVKDYLESNCAPVSPTDATPVDKTERMYICDPVMGDHGRLYVDESVVPIYRDVLLPMASIATPNGFEASVLSQVAENINTVELARKAALWFHASPRNLPRVVIKSFEVEKYPGKICALVSEVERQDGEKWEENKARQYLILVEKVPLGYVSGTGDIFASLLIGHMSTMTRKEVKIDSAGKSLFVKGVELAMSSTVKVLQRTRTDEAPPFAKGRTGDLIKELPIVGAQDLLLDQSSPIVEATELVAE